MIIDICSFRYPTTQDSIVINTTSSSKTSWMRRLSPFFLGPVRVPNGIGYEAFNVENAWQFSKVYEEHVDKDGWPTQAWYDWAADGYGTKRAIRYPMGKGHKPLYSFWNMERLDYIDARKKIYCPIYAQCVEGTDAYERLKYLAERHRRIQLWDYDGYDYRSLDMSLKDVLNCETRKMGHAFVLAMMLKNKRWWENENNNSNGRELGSTVATSERRRTNRFET